MIILKFTFSKTLSYITVSFIRLDYTSRLVYTLTVHTKVQLQQNTRTKLLKTHITYFIISIRLGRLPLFPSWETSNIHTPASPPFAAKPVQLECTYTDLKLPRKVYVKAISLYPSTQSCTHVHWFFPLSK